MINGKKISYQVISSTNHKTIWRNPMKTRLIVFALLAMCTSAYADFIEDSPAPAITSVPVNLGRHHISIGILGTFKSTSGDFVIPELGFDASEGSSGFLNYRYSFTEQFDLAVDMHGWVSEAELYGVNIQTLVTGFGLGARYNIPAGQIIHPYIQLNVCNITEQLTGSYGSLSETYSESETGFGANAGAEIRLGKLISIPIEFMYLNGEPADDISGYGFSAGVSFNWGRIE